MESQLASAGRLAGYLKGPQEAVFGAALQGLSAPKRGLQNNMHPTDMLQDF